MKNYLNLSLTNPYGMNRLMSAAGGCRPQRNSCAYFFFFAAFLAGFLVATRITSFQSGVYVRVLDVGASYFFFFAAFLAGFLVATRITSFPEELPRLASHRRLSWGFFARVYSSVRSMKFCASLMAPSTS